jgi:excisionase family DNA binding protein
VSGEWLRTGEAAERLGVSASTVRRLIERDVLRARQWETGAWYQVAAADVERLTRVTRSGVPDDDLAD